MASTADIKAQAAVDMARDPSTTVTAEDAQRKMVEENLKAGVPAFTFDPDATPEQKAAQARAVSCLIPEGSLRMLIDFSTKRVPEGFHHQHKSKGVGVATDIDDGQPGAYDLPPPSTAGALAATAPPKDKAGKPLTGGVNGHIDADENERWIERAGWAPRFGNGASDDESMEGESFAYHQTWIEGQLDDKFFGGEVLVELLGELN
jgi:hypothetical protein